MLTVRIVFAVGLLCAPEVSAALVALVSVFGLLFVSVIYIT